MRSRNTELPITTAVWAILIVFTVVLSPSPIHATTISVTTTEDELNSDGDCSLREAIRAANLDVAVDACAAGSGSDDITLPAGTYTLSISGGEEDAAATGDLDLTGVVTLTGAGMASTIVDGALLDRVFDVQSGGDATISDLTVQHGRPTEFPGYGGGIRDAGTLTVSEVRLFDNHAEYGGGMSVVASPATLSMLDSLVDANEGAVGGGALHVGGGSGTVERTTITGHGANSGSVVWITYPNPGPGSPGSLVVEDSSISDNDTLGIDNDTYVTLIGTQLTNNTTGMDNSGGFASGGLALVRTSLVAGNDGVGLANIGAMTIEDSTIRDNTGGGIENSLGLSVERSTISGNTSSTSGAGLRNFGIASLSNTTVSGNSGQAFGAGIFHNPDSVFANPALTLNNVTITANNLGGGSGAGLYAGSATQTVRTSNTIIAGNLIGGVVPSDCSATIDSLGNNLIGDASGCTITGDTTGNLLDVDPQLGPLANNGGLTETHALLVGSPAIDAGGSTTCEATDQRGVARPQGEACDIGAYEASSDCTGAVDGTACADGVFCNGYDSCSAGSCSVHSGDPCASEPQCNDTCDEATNVCSVTPNGMPCDDGQLCTASDSCNDGTCVGDAALANGTPCDDSEPCTTSDSCNDGTCIGSPPIGCNAAVSGKAKLSLKHDPSNVAKDAVKWSWRSAATFDVTELGSPDTATDLVLCVFDQNGLTLSATAPADGICGTKPCWNVSSTLVKYTNKTLAPDGLAKLIGKGGGPGAGKLKVKGKGPLLGLPVLGLATPVRGLLMRPDTGACWNAMFSTNIKVNDATRFLAIGD
jgi:CSLREA domain-containing protein